MAPKNIKSKDTFNKNAQDMNMPRDNISREGTVKSTKSLIKKSQP
jgi:hypothetical protein